MDFPNILVILFMKSLEKTRFIVYLEVKKF